MATDCHKQLNLSFQPKIVLDFDGGQITSDSGLLLLRQFDEQLALTKRLWGLVSDWRHPVFIEHHTHEMLSQRIYQIAAGYEDCAAAATLRSDPTFQTIVGKPNPLASQPTLSRLENHADWQTINRLSAMASKCSRFSTANTASTCITRCFSSRPKRAACCQPGFVPATPLPHRASPLSCVACGFISPPAGPDAICSGKSGTNLSAYPVRHPVKVCSLWSHCSYGSRHLQHTDASVPGSDKVNDQTIELRQMAIQGNFYIQILKA